MKTYTQEEVINLLRRAAKNWDEAIFLQHIFPNCSASVEFWIKYNILEPPQEAEIILENKTDMSEIDWKEPHEYFSDIH